MIKRFEDLPSDEQDDVVAACSARGVDVGDFEFHINETFPMHGIGPIERSVAVSRKGHDVQRTYRDGNSPCWTEEFDADLMSGLFD